MQKDYGDLMGRVLDLENRKHEHETVLKTLRSLDPSRKAYRSISGVLVERSVEEVIPAVQSNLDQVPDFTLVLISS